MWRSRLVAALGYLGLALFICYPAWTSPSHGVIGDWTHPDALGNHWLYEWTAHQLANGRSILHNDRYYWPVGDAPFLAGNGSDAVPFSLLGSWVAWPFSVSLWCLLTITLNGCAGFAVAESVGVGAAAAGTTGALLVFCPYVVRELSAGRFAQAGLWAGAFFLARWIRLLQCPCWGNAALAGALFGLTAFQYWYYGLWMAMAGAIIWLFQRNWAGLLRFVPFAVLATLPPLALFLANWSKIPGVEESTFPHPISVDYALFAGFPAWSGSGQLGSIGVPLVFSGLTLLGWNGAERNLRRGLIAAGALFFALCLGPDLLNSEGASSGIPGPFVLLYRWTPTLRRFWWPYRHIAPLSLVLLPLAARGAERALAWLNLRAGAALIIGLVPIELYARGLVVEASVSYFSPPESYQLLATMPEGRLLELPLYEKIARSESSLSYQLVHGMTLLNGHAMWVDRVRPPAWDSWLAAQPLLHGLRRFEAGDLTGNWTLEPGTALWATDAVGYISINREFFPGELGELRDLEASFLTEWFGEPTVKSGGVRIWDVHAAPNTHAYFWPKWSPPADYVAATGLTALPDSVRSAGWLNWPRNVPPTAPEAKSADFDLEIRNSRLPPALRRKLDRASESDTARSP